MIRRQKLQGALNQNLCYLARRGLIADCMKVRGLDELILIREGVVKLGTLR